MSKYRIYAGLATEYGFDGPVYQGIFECPSQEAANWKAFDLAWDEYESHGGKHGLPDRDEVYDRLLEIEYIDPHSQSESEIDEIVDDCYYNQVSERIVYKAVPVEDTEE